MNALALQPRPAVLRATEAFAIPGEESLIDCINPDTGRSCIEGETLEQIRLRYPGAEVVNIDEHCKARAEKHDAPVEWKEVTEERYWEMLEVLPPACQQRGGFLVGEPWDHHAVSGRARYGAYLERGGKFYESLRPVTVSEFKFLYESINTITPINE